VSGDTTVAHSNNIANYHNVGSRCYTSRTSSRVPPFNCTGQRVERNKIPNAVVEKDSAAHRVNAGLGGGTRFEQRPDEVLRDGRITAVRILAAVQRKRRECSASPQPAAG
jgi:hypothetical protein